MHVFRQSRIDFKRPEPQDVGAFRLGIIPGSLEVLKQGEHEFFTRRFVSRRNKKTGGRKVLHMGKRGDSISTARSCIQQGVSHRHEH